MVLELFRNTTNILRLPVHLIEICMLFRITKNKFKITIVIAVQNNVF